MTRIPVNPELLTWARERAGLDTLALAGRFPKLSEWEAGELQPTLRQLEDFARAVHVAVGYLFLPALDFIGTATLQDAPERVAEAMRQTLALSMAEQQQSPTWTDALRLFVDKAEDAGVLVMASGVVGSNSHRKLSVEEFRGFALADELAPLVFLNGADSKAAQMFTLAHELAHLWLRKSGISDPEASRLAEPGIERWCNAVAAGFLMPLALLRQDYQAGVPIAEEIQRFARAVLSSTLEGQTLFQDAFRMLGVRKTSTFYEAAHELGGIP